MQKLQDILKPPKLRGEFGELMLERILEEVLPKTFYETNYKFTSGNIVDAVIKLKDSQLVCIDSKFPLDSLTKDNQLISNEVSSQFIRDIKKHIDDISSKYIVPDESTVDFALMYIPLESVYYQVLLASEKLSNYSREKHVIIVSPMTLYTYLSIILIGLKGQEIEKSTRYVLSGIQNTVIELEKFIEEYAILGVHINNAKSKYDSSKLLIDKLLYKVKNIEKDDVGVKV